MSTRHRPERVAELVREAVTAFLAADAKDPRITGLVTVTGVEVNAALTLAHVRVSIMGTPDEKDRTLEGLRSASGFLRRDLGKSVRMRVIPEIAFEYDRGLEHALRIERMLNELKREPGERGEGGPPPDPGGSDVE
ncbi:MAG: 30S ribosome-binding factor RbfA [Gemmatimonadales bacterium]